MGSILRMLVLLAVSWFLYSYYIQQKQPQEVSTRYQDPESTFSTDDSADTSSNIDDCQRYISADRLQDCLETKLKKAAEKHSP